MSRTSLQPTPHLVRLLGFARALQDTKTFGELLQVAVAEMREVTGYTHAWLMVKEEEQDQHVRLIDVSGAAREDIWQVAPVLDLRGDEFMHAVLSSPLPTVVVDARLDPRTDKRLVERLQPRTLIHIPLSLLEVPFGAFGIGTFGDDGCRAPSEAELDYLTGMAQQISVAASRIRYLEQRMHADKARSEMERRLLQMQKLESIGMLAGGVAHDFNNLLTVIIASASLAEPLIENADARAEVQQILAAAGRAGALTRQLLAVGRSQGLSLAALDVNQLLRNLLQLMRRVLPENIKLDLIEGQGVPLTEGDASQIEQVFMNLFINARDAMPEGGRLSVETDQMLVDPHDAERHLELEPGRYVCVSVGDTGLGMSREVLERIFEPFFTTKSPRAGTGLGLAVAYGIVRQHQGMLQCKSEVGVGTTFKVYLPMARRPAVNVETKRQVRSSRGSESVLVAEDDEAVRNVAMRILERAGYDVTSVADGNAACQAATARDFDLVLLDMVMPGMSCRDTVRALRGARPSTRILLSSGYTAGEAVTALIEQTGLDILRKPYDAEQMLRAVRAALGTERRS